MKLATIASGQKKGSTTLLLAKIDKHESRNTTAAYSCISALVLTYFRLKVRATFFQHETVVASFLHLVALYFKVIFNHTSKRQFVVLHYRILQIKFILACVKSYIFLKFIVNNNFIISIMLKNACFVQN